MKSLELHLYLCIPGTVYPSCILSHFLMAIKTRLFVGNKRVTLTHTPDFVHLGDDADVFEGGGGDGEEFFFDQVHRRDADAGH